MNLEAVLMNPLDGCDEPQNAESLSGKAAVVMRGTCFFEDKVLRATSAGAELVIVINNVAEDLVPIAYQNASHVQDLHTPVGKRFDIS